MSSLANCFVDDVIESVEFSYTGPSGTRLYHFRTLKEMDAHLSASKEADYTCLTISICQRNSYVPLQITKTMMDCIASHYGIGPSFWDLPSCFYARNLDLEEVFCIPFTHSARDSCFETSYTIRYPKFKMEQNTWVIQQSGIYHRFNAAMRQSLYILFSPTPNSKAQQEIRELLLHDPKGPNKEVENSPFWLHKTLFSTYCPPWRQYIAAQEREVLKIRNSTIAGYIDRPLTIGQDSLSKLVSLDNRFLQIPAILSQATEVLDELLALIDHQQKPPLMTAELTCQLATELRAHRRQCAAYSRTAKYLQQRSQTTAQLLSETLSLRDQAIAKEQNELMLRMNKSVAFITTVTLFYLPASSVSTFFGMNFFSMDEENRRIIVTPMIWIYVVVAVILTGATFLLLPYDGKRPLVTKFAIRCV